MITKFAPKVELTPDWKKLLRYAWSVRLMFFAALLTGLEVALPLFQHRIPIPNGYLALGSGLLTVSAFIMRFVSQKVFKED